MMMFIPTRHEWECRLETTPTRSKPAGSPGLIACNVQTAGDYRLQRPGGWRGTKRMKEVVLVSKLHTMRSPCICLQCGKEFDLATQKARCPHKRESPERLS